MELTPELKLTEVGVIPQEWDCRAIGDLIDLLTGFPFPSRGYARSGVRLLRGSNVKRGNTDWSNDLTVYWPSIRQELQKFVLRCGDIVVAMDGSLVGRSFASLEEADVPALLLQRVARIRSEVVAQSYLKAWICSQLFTDHCDAVKTTTAIPHISPDDIRSFKVALPPTKPEQEAIAEALNDADALIESLEQLVVKKRQIKLGAMQELLTGKNRLPGFNGRWDLKPLMSVIAALEAGVSVNSIDDTGGVRDGAAAVLKTSCVERGIFRPQESKTIAPRDLSRAKLAPLANTVLISRMNTIDLVGECGYVDAEYPWLFVPDRLWMTRFRRDAEVSAKWLSQVLSSDSYRRLLKEIATGKRNARCDKAVRDAW